MAKTKISYFCQSCGSQADKWAGKCNSCGSWNTIVEEIVHKETKNNRLQVFTKNENGGSNKSILLQDVGTIEHPRIPVAGKELTRVLGGGIVPGSLVLFGGEPGIGKSTLMLQVALRLKHLKILYVSGEESEQQIKMRADSIGFLKNETILRCNPNSISPHFYLLLTFLTTNIQYFQMLQSKCYLEH